MLLALRESECCPLADAAVDYLLSARNSDGGWGGGPSLSTALSAAVVSSVEETSVALEAICHYFQTYALANGLKNERVFGDPADKDRSVDRLWRPSQGRESQCLEAIIDAARWLTDAIDREQHQTAWPIGFYFAKLWYYEKLYPLVFATAAMGAVIRTLRPQSSLQH